MRREGYELTVGGPSAVAREVDGAVQEPVERLSVDVPEEYVGAVTSLMAVRRGRSTSSGLQPMMCASSAAYFSGWAAGRSILLSTGTTTRSFSSAR